MDDKAILSLVTAQLLNDFLVQGRISNHNFIAAAGSGLHVHGRCSEVMDKRVAEFDLSEARAESAMDPVSTGFHLNKTIAESGSVHANNGILLEILRQVQDRKAS